MTDKEAKARGFKKRTPENKDAIAVECTRQEIKVIVKLLRSSQTPGAQDKILVGQLQQKWEQHLDN